MDNFATRFFFEVADAADSAGYVRWLHVAYEYLQTIRYNDVGAAVVMFFAFVGACWMAWRMVGPTVRTLSYPIRRLRAYQGRELMRRSRRKFVEQTVADKVTDILDDLMVNGMISRKEVQELTGKLGKAFKIVDLIPREPYAVRVFKLRARLKAKYASKIVDLAKARKERDKAVNDKPTSLKDRLARQRKVG